MVTAVGQRVNPRLGWEPRLGGFVRLGSNFLSSGEHL